jgi:hypothetical protein
VSQQLEGERQILIKGEFMAKEESKGVDKTKRQKPREIVFRCQCCDEFKQLEEMRVITRFFPVLVICRDCEKAMR